MPKKTSHPDEELFNYLNGSLDKQATQSIEEHLSKCADCALVARLIHSLKVEAGTLLADVGSTELPDAQSQALNSESQISNLKSEISEAHPDTSELASFFYAKSRARRDVAAHIAVCRSCAAEIAEYARADRLAAEYNATQGVSGEMPGSSWKMIHEWEESSFATLKPASSTIGQEMLNKLSRLVGERDAELREMARNVSSGSPAREGELVPVIVVDRDGELRGVEMFEKTAGPRGASILKHAEESDRFHNKPVHALLDFGEGNRLVVSDLIRKDTARMQPARPRARLRRADYFIIED